MELLSNHHDPLATPIILMTSYGYERIAVEAPKSGALDYVVKSSKSMLDMPHLAARAIHDRKTESIMEIQTASRDISERKLKDLCGNRMKIFRRLIKEPSKARFAQWTSATVKQKDTHNV